MEGVDTNNLSLRIGCWGLVLQSHQDAECNLSLLCILAFHLVLIYQARTLSTLLYCRHESFHDKLFHSCPGPQCSFQVKDHDGGCPISRCLPALRDQQAGRQQRDGELFLKMIEAKKREEES